MSQTYRSLPHPSHHRGQQSKVYQKPPQWHATTQPPSQGLHLMPWGEEGGASLPQVPLLRVGSSTSGQGPCPNDTKHQGTSVPTPGLEPPPSCRLGLAILSAFSQPGHCCKSPKFSAMLPNHSPPPRAEKSNLRKARSVWEEPEGLVGPSIVPGRVAISSASFYKMEEQ